MDYWAKDIYSWGISSAEVYPRSSIAIQKTVRMSWISCPLNDLTDGSTSSEPMELCITSIVKTLTENHTLDDRNHQGHHTTLLLSETLLSTARASMCVGEVKSLESTAESKFWTALGRQRGVVRVLQWFQQDGANPHTSNESLAWLQKRFPDRLISRRCGPQWSPHSPDLNHLSLTWRQQSQQQ